MEYYYINEQSEDISRGVERISPEDQGAGDQGIMFDMLLTKQKTLYPLDWIYLTKFSKNWLY